MPTEVPHGTSATRRLWRKEDIAQHGLEPLL
jgi:hypothetical protein